MNDNNDTNELDQITSTPMAAESKTELDIKNEEFHKDVVRDSTEDEFDATLLTGKDLNELLEDAKALLLLTPKTAFTRLKAIRSVFYDTFNKLKEEAREQWNTGENEEDAEFIFDQEIHVEKLKGIESEIKKAQEEEKKRVEEEKKKNLALKNGLLKRLEELVVVDETEQTIQEVKDIQREWKTIRVLPKDVVNDLWDKYNNLLNKYYDNHSIHIELKELDRQKNLESKIELTKKVEELKNEKSLKKSFILLNKYHEEFKNTGPVPRESREPIWQAFKSATDSVYEAKRAIYEELEKGKEDNLANKKILADKADLLNAVKPKDVKGWNEKAKAFDALFEEWKKIGPVPKSNKDAVWIQFNGVRNDFYTLRKEFFKELNSVRNENLKLKEVLCDKVEALKNSTDWASTTKQIIALQAEWKTIGPVPEKVNQAIWKRFRSGCDHFFSAKNDAFSGKIEEEKLNLATKEELIEQLKVLATEEDKDHKAAFEALKKINASWRSAGYVPHKHVKRISKAYDEANNAVYQKYSKQIDEAKAANLVDHYRSIKDASPDGIRELENEERNIKRRITTLNEEVTSIERNMSFFSKSKTADKMLKDFGDKIQKANNQIAKLKKELGVIKSTKREQAAEKPAEPDTEE